MTTTEEGKDGTGPVSLRSEVWVNEFERQLSRPHLLELLQVYARQRARLVARYRTIDEHSYAADLVQDVIVDTLAGVLAWDPSRVDLKGHVRGAIKSRSRHDYRRAERSPYQTLDVDDPRIAAELVEHEARQERQELRRHAVAIIEALRKLAANDREVLLLIEAYEGAVSKRAEVLELTGLTVRQYKAARERLTGLRDSLPHDLHPRHRGTPC
jgi:DNA-directed RNA polymerase specialized sigma24 family protein